MPRNGGVAVNAKKPDVTSFDIGTNLVLPYDINDSGKVVGTYITDANSYGFMYYRGHVTKIEQPNSFRTRALKVNEFGKVLGQYSDQNHLVHGFTYYKGRHAPFDALDAKETYPQDINNRGAIVGDYYDYTGSHHAFLYDNGKFHDILIPGSQSVFANGINDFGQVVGSFDVQGETGLRGFVYQNGKVATIDVPGARTFFRKKSPIPATSWAPISTALDCTTLSTSKGKFPRRTCRDHGPPMRWTSTTQGRSWGIMQTPTTPPLLRGKQREFCDH